MQIQKRKTNPTEEKAVPVYLWLILAGLTLWNAANIWLQSPGLLRLSIGFILEQASVFASSIVGSVIFSTAVLILFLLWLLYRYFPSEKVQLKGTNSNVGRGQDANEASANARQEEQRFDVDLPNRRQRETILSHYTTDLALTPNVNLGRIARSTTGFSEENLASLCKEASQIATRQSRNPVNMADFEEALDRMFLIDGSPILLQDEERHAAAFHEAGHVLIAWRLMAYPPIKTATIIPQDQDAVSSNQTLEKLRLPADQDTLLTSLSILLAGRAAEEVGVGSITTTGVDDLRQATRLAHRMVAHWGMGSLGVFVPEGLVDLSQDKASANRDRAYSEETAAHIDREVQDLLQTRYTAVRNALVNEKQCLTQLAETLMEEETLERDDIARILGDQPDDNNPLIETTAIQPHSTVS